LGWILAVISGGLTWLLAETVISVSGAGREVVEGMTAVFAALVLFSVSYWLVSKAEARKWQQYIRSKVQSALGGGRIAALIGVSFLAVYREAFETVLFYQAMWMQSESARAFVLSGFLLGLGFVLLLVWCIFRLGMKLPLRFFFGISSALLYFLAFVLIGDGIRDLQATGWFSETPVPSIPQLPYLGIYATAETLLAQAAMIVALFAALFWLWGRPAATYRDA
jgi:high-affinity iron transporter